MRPVEGSGGSAAASGSGPEEYGADGYGLGGFWRVARRVILDPSGFFGGVAPGGPVRGAVLFAVACNTVGTLLAFLVEPLDPLVPGPTTLGRLGISDPTAQDLVLIAVFVLLLPLLVLLSVYVGAAIQHLFVWVFVREGRRDFYATLKATAYPSAVGLVSWVPVVGPFAAVYSFYLVAVGVRRMHSTTFRRALLAVAVPVLFTVVPALFALGSALGAPSP